MSQAVLSSNRGDGRLSFEHGFLVLQRESDLSRSLWVTHANDRGFNATPVPVIVARPFAELFPVPRAISLGFGVLFVTVIVLLIVPTQFVIVEDLRGILSPRSRG